MSILFCVYTTFRYLLEALFNKSKNIFISFTIFFKETLLYTFELLLRENVEKSEQIAENFSAPLIYSRPSYTFILLLLLQRRFNQSVVRSSSGVQSIYREGSVLYRQSDQLLLIISFEVGKILLFV